ncbi:MAG: hypothetical protein ACIAQF_05255 [Phycisphaerales bacterium JB065]
MFQSHTDAKKSLPPATIVAEDLYWCVVDPQTLPQRVRTAREIHRANEALDALFEEVLPCRLSEVHRVYAPVGDGRVIGCAAPTEVVAGVQAEGRLSAMPDRIPDGFGIEPQAIRDHLNLLSGQYEPPAISARRRSFVVASAIAWITAALMLFVGGLLKSREKQIEARGLNDRTEALMASVVGERAQASGQPVVALFQSEWNEARRAVGPETKETSDPDLIDQFSSLASAWPAEPARRLRRLEVSAGRVMILAATDDAEAAARFFSAFGDVPGWTPKVPSVTAAEGESLVRIELQHEGAGSP